MANIQTAISFSLLGIGSVLKNHHLVVPPNQRDYSWTTKEVNTLFQDITRAIYHNEQEYFLGTIVTIQKPDNILEIADGQQRLATISILLSAFSDYLKEKDPMIHKSIEGNFLIFTDRKSRADLPRIRLNLNDNDFFRTQITGEDSPPPTKKSQKLLEDAFSEAKKQVEEIVRLVKEEEHGNVINRWIDFIEENAIVVLLRVQNEANAYRMFETLNDRGLKTSQADLIKNYLFGRASSRIQEVQQKWAYMQGALETIEDKDITIQFLRHAIEVLGGFVRQTQVYETIQNLAKAEQPVINFMNNIELLASSYVAIYNSDHEKWNEYPAATRNAIKVLNLFGIKPMRPLLLAITNKFTKHTQPAPAFQLCVTLCVRLMIAGSTRTGAVEERLANAAYKIFQGEIDSAKSLLQFLKPIVPTDEKFKTEFQNATVSNNKLARYYLRSLEMVAKEQPDPWHIPNDDHAVINLEHVLPENPADQWPEFTDEEADLYYKRIGNMALLLAKENSGLRSVNIETKKAVYAKSPYVLTQQISQALTWDVGEIINRQQVLADLALKAWPIK